MEPKVVWSDSSVQAAQILLWRHVKLAAKRPRFHFLLAPPPPPPVAAAMRGLPSRLENGVYSLRTTDLVQIMNAGGDAGAEGRRGGDDARTHGISVGQRATNTAMPPLAPPSSPSQANLMHGSLAGDDALPCHRYRAMQQRTEHGAVACHGCGLAGVCGRPQHPGAPTRRWLSLCGRLQSVISNGCGRRNAHSPRHFVRTTPAGPCV